MDEFKAASTAEGMVKLCVYVPSEQAETVKSALEGFLTGLRPQGGDAALDGPAPGHALREARRRAGLTQKTLGEAVGCKPNHLSEMEHGKRPIGKAMAKRLALALNTTYKHFL